MAGHSKWANIRRKKERTDAKKGKIFSHIAREIISAVKQGGPHPNTNAKLRLAIQKAKSVNFPSENIERNIKKAASSDQANFSEVTYEFYGHGGVGIIVEVMTDNKNRMASEMRIAINKKGGTIASPGSVSFNFDRKGVIQIAKNQAVEEELFVRATDAGADDFEVTDDAYIVITLPDKLFEVKERLKGYNIQEVSLEMIPKTFIVCDDRVKRANHVLINFLEELDDVNAVFHNMS